MTAPDEDWTEATDANIPRVDLVGKAANGSPGFLLMKQEGGLLSPDEVRGLIVKAEQGQKVEGGPVRDDITMTGSPAAVTKMIAEAAQRAKQPLEATVTVNGTVTDPKRLGEAIASAAHQMSKAHGPGFVASTLTIPEAQEGTMTAPAPVVKDDPVDADPAEIDLTQPLADSSDVLAESMPGSAAWEQLDADSAMKWTAVLGRAKNALEVLATRERVEGESPLGDYDDNENAWDLDDACCAIDFAIGTLAAYAVGEQATSEQMDDLASITKAAAAIDPNQVAVLEAYGVLAKAGRVLSAANEAAIRGAVDSLSNVLSTLSAPIPDAAPVAKSNPKETPVTEAIAEVTKAGEAVDAASTELASTIRKIEKADDTAAVAAAAAGLDLVEPETAPVVKAKVAPQFVQTPAQVRAAFNAPAPYLTLPMAKAVAYVTLGGKIESVTKAGDPQMVVFDADGNIVGTISPDDLSPIAAPTPPDGGDATGAAPEDDAAAAPAADATPDATVAPAPDAAAAPAPPVDENGLLQKAIEQSTALMKSTIEEAVEAALTPLRDRLDKVESQPMPGPLLKGALPGNNGPVMRGQDGTDPRTELVKRIQAETDPNKKAGLNMELVALMVGQAPPLR